MFTKSEILDNLIAQIEDLLEAAGNNWDETKDYQVFDRLCEIRADYQWRLRHAKNVCS